MTAVLEVRNATVLRAQRRLLDGLSIAAHAGEVLVIMGENGAGKSTLVKAMAGDVALDQGDVLLHGRPLATWTALQQAQRRAVLPQDHALAFEFTAFEVVLLGRAPHCAGNPSAADRAVARRALERTDALHLAERSYPTLSGGERARVMLARVIAQVDAGRDIARLLLLDEPSAALDLAHQHAAFEVVRALARDEGIAVVAVLHDPNLAAIHADRVALLRQGRLIAHGPVDETLTVERLRACFSIELVRLTHPTLGVPMFAAASATAHPAGRSRPPPRSAAPAG